MVDTQGGDSSVLATLFAHNTWANLKLLAFCAGLSAEQLDGTATGGFGTIRATLRHILGSEASYVERTNGRPPPQRLRKDEFPEFAVMQEVARWNGDQMR